MRPVAALCVPVTRTVRIVVMDWQTTALLTDRDLAPRPGADLLS